MQIIPLVYYDVKINGREYSYTALKGLPPSDYMNNIRKQVGNANVEIEVEASCFTNTQPASPALLDALFLLMSYSITRVNGLSMEESLCLYDIAERYNLPIDQTMWSRDTAGKIDDPNELWVFANTLAEEGKFRSVESPQRAIAEAATNVVLKRGYTQASLADVAYALLLAYPPMGEDGVEWRQAVFREWGKRLALLTPATASQQSASGDVMALMADFLIESAASVPLSAHTDVVSATNEFIQRTDIQEHERYQDRLSRWFEDLRLTNEGWVASRVEGLVVGWLLKTGYAPDVTLHWDSEPDVADKHWEGLKATPTINGSIKLSTRENPRTYLTVDEVFGEGSNWKRMDVGIATEGGSRELCSNPEISAILGWPLGELVPLDPTTCAYHIDVPSIANRVMAEQSTTDKLKFAH